MLIWVELGLNVPDSVHDASATSVFTTRVHVTGLTFVVVIPLLVQASPARIITSKDVRTEAMILLDQLLDLLKVRGPKLRLKPRAGIQPWLLCFLPCQRCCNQERVSNLSPVPSPFPLGMLVTVLKCELHDICFHNEEGPFSAGFVLLLLRFLEPFDIGPEYFLYLCRPQALIVQNYVNSR